MVKDALAGRACCAEDGVGWHDGSCGDENGERCRRLREVGKPYL